MILSSFSWGGFAIQEVIRTSIRTKLASVIVQNDFEVMILLIIGKIVIAKHVSNLLDDIKFIARIIESITFFIAIELLIL